MKSNKIELVKDFDSDGNVLDSEVYVSRINTKLELVYECMDILTRIEKGD